MSAKTTHDERAACFPSSPVSVCRNCTRSHIADTLREPELRFGVVIDASITIREGICGMYHDEETQR